MSNDEYEVVEAGSGGSTGVPIDAETIKEAFHFFGTLAECARDVKIADIQMTKYRVMRDIAITEITERYKFAHALMNKTFKERRKIIEKQFEVIDKGLETHDYQLVNMGLQSVTELVKENPFKFFQVTTAAERYKMLEDGGLSVE